MLVVSKWRTLANVTRVLVAFQEVVRKTAVVHRTVDYCPLCGHDNLRRDTQTTATCGVCKIAFSTEPLGFDLKDMARVPECLRLDPTPEQPVYPESDEEEERWWDEEDGA